MDIAGIINAIKATKIANEVKYYSQGVKDFPKSVGEVVKAVPQGVGMVTSALSPLETAAAGMIQNEGTPKERINKAFLEGQDLVGALESKNIPGAFPLGMAAGAILPGAGEIKSLKHTNPEYVYKKSIDWIKNTPSNDFYDFLAKNNLGKETEKLREMFYKARRDLNKNPMFVYDKGLRFDTLGPKGKDIHEIAGKVFNKNPDVIFEIKPEKINNRDGIYLNFFAVPHEQRGKGIGTDILKTFTQELDNKKIPGKLMVEGDRYYGHDSKKLTEFYTRLGFEPSDNYDPARGGEMFYYPKIKYTYTPSKNLTPSEKQIEKEFANQIENNWDAIKSEYIAKNGNILNTDEFREMSPAYRGNRYELSAAVHEPASSAIKKIYVDELERPAPRGRKNAVLFMAGGTGAGKTNSLKSFSTLNQLKDEAHIVYDTNMSEFTSAKKKVDQALEKGKDVVYTYVYRDPVDSLENGAIPRAEKMAIEMGTGRTVPISEHEKTHIGSLDVFKKMIKEYHGNPKVRFFGIDNSLGKGKQQIIPLSKIDQYKIKTEGLLNELKRVIQSKFYGDYENPLYKGFNR